MTTKAPAGFLTHFDLRELDGGDCFLVMAPLVYLSKDGQGYTVPAGVTTDFASVPRVLWNVLPPFGKHTRASVLHDWLYQAAPDGMTRGKADDLFRQAMDVCGVGWFTRQTMWAGVRSGGWVPWKKYRSRSVSEPASP
jgi:hypothetical protein